jgi:hypothetical protein
MERRTVTLDDIERRLVSEHRKPFYEWIRHVVGLSTASLTLLVALQSHYIPNDPKGIWLLAVCWLSLALSVISGVLALRGEYQTPLDAARNLREKRRAHGDAETVAWVARGSGYIPRPIFKWARGVMVCSFLLGVVSIAVFAVWNLPL